MIKSGGIETESEYYPKSVLLGKFSAVVMPSHPIY